MPSSRPPCPPPPCTGERGHPLGPQGGLAAIVCPLPAPVDHRGIASTSAAGVDVQAGTQNRRFQLWANARRFEVSSPSHGRMVHVIGQRFRDREWFLGQCTSNGYEGKRERAGERGAGPSTLGEAVHKFNLKVVAWSGRTFERITFDGTRVAAILIPAPATLTQPGPLGVSLLDEASAAMTDAYASVRGCAGTSAPAHRGDFTQITCGMTLAQGGGRPTNFRTPSAPVQEATNMLLSNRAIQVLAASGSGCLEAFAPGVHRLYKSTLESLLAHDPRLRRNFEQSVFAATTFNLGPQVCTRIHRDCKNLPGGFCAITALGDYDARKGGHLILWDLQLAIEFPPGTTILLTSAVVQHSNLPTEARERRMSVVQYSAGGLFRYVDDGCRLRNKIRESGTESELAVMAGADALRPKAMWEGLPVHRR